MRRAAVAAALLLAAASLHGALAKIHHSVVERDDRRLIQLTEAFGFAGDGEGHINMTIRDVKIYAPQDAVSKGADLDQFGFFLSPLEADGVLEAELATEECILNKIKPSRMPTFKDSQIQDVIHGKKTEAVFPLRLDSPGLFYLYFANCDPERPVSFDALIEQFNLDSSGRKDYLSVGETQLETVYWVMFGLFTTVCGVWAWYVWSNREYAHRIHGLMGVLCAFKALTVMSQAGMYHFIERTGHPDGWNVAYYIFTFCRGILFFTVVVLIGTGWSYMKPFLGDREKSILMVVVPLQVFANIAIIVTEEESPSAREWFTWRDLFHLVDIVCCCAILFPIVWSIKQLREASRNDGKAARTLQKLTLFRQFYVMVVVYIYFTRIVVYLLKTTTMQFEYSWVSDAADQLATLAFYVWTAVKFRPQPNNPYLKLEQSEIEL